MSETSPTPWRLNGRTIVAGDPSDEINVAEMCGSMSNPDIAADAALIVHAVNCHAEMVAKLGQVHTELEEAANLLAGAGLKGMASIYRAVSERVGGVFARAAQTNTGE